MSRQNAGGVWRDSSRIGWLLVLLVAPALLIGAAYQVRPTVHIPVGDATVDTALVRNFNAPERQAVTDGGRRFRWTRGEGTLELPGIGRGAYGVDLVLNGANNPQPDVRILANGVIVGAFRCTPDFATYHVDIPADLTAHGSLTLAVSASPFTPRGDRRTLGIVVEDVTLRPVGGGVLLPPVRIAFSLWLGAVCVGLALMASGIGRRGAAVGAVVAGGTMAVWIAANRLFLTVDAGNILRAGVLMVAVCAAIRFAVPPLCRRCGLATTAHDVRWLAAVAGAVVALRFVGVMHPLIAVVDLRFHLNRLADVVDRHQLLLPIESAEVGGRTILYAPTPYLVLWPFTLVVRDRVLLLVLFALAIDTARLCIVWATVRVAMRDLRTANLAVATMAAMPVGWIVYSWGVFANIFAEGLLAVLFGLLVLGYGRLAGRRGEAMAWCAVFVAVIALTLLSHIGVFVLTAATLVLYGTVRLLLAARAQSRAGWTALVLFTVAAVIAGIVAFAVFWRFPAQNILSGRQTTVIARDSTPDANGTMPAQPSPQRYRTGGATPDDRIGLPAIATDNFAVALVREAWEMGYAFYGVWPVVAALLGLALLARSVRDDAFRVSGLGSRFSLLLTLAIWLLVVLVMLVIGIVARLYVRYALYALPAVAVGAGIALAWLSRQGRWGGIAVAALLSLSVAWSLLMWYDRIVYAFKPLI